MAVERAGDIRFPNWHRCLSHPDAERLFEKLLRLLLLRHLRRICTVVFQLQHGMRLCSTDTAEYIGDPMLIPICSYKVLCLMRLSFKGSTWLNGQFGFSNPHHGKRLEDNLDVDTPGLVVRFRFNFRFLASKVNLSFLGAFVLLLYVLYFL
ncbi:hypothetical protein PsorP6_006122 [Peronosclerospora sorghi]|uniref:Uncharacterized protein n=1 Tax=Peronosclerospora sorghi TaxID=230839 RepID=A0ACC0W1Y2_9STRA|nr:hypothetical protein PsorP6_006122 [Peronosclerospora sorghi]